MSVIAPDEKADFVAILHCHQLAEADFMLQETDTTDVVDEAYPLQGCVTIVLKSTLKEREYRIGHGTAARSGELNRLIPIEALHPTRHAVAVKRSTCLL